MPGNTFGKNFRLTTFGESHGRAMGGIIDGCPPGLLLDISMVQEELDRRRPGSSKAVSQRNEPDRVEFLSGLFDGKTTGMPIGFIIYNQDAKEKDYEGLEGVLRPSHSDLPLFLKYGIYDHRGGGRLSGRETVCRVAGGAVAKQLLAKKGISILAFTSAIGPYSVDMDPGSIRPEDVYGSPVKCPDQELAGKIEKMLEELRDKGDSIGGKVTCLVRNVPLGLGDPVFGKLDADLAGAMISIGGAKGFEIGDGFASANMKGTEHNDPIRYESGQFYTETNHAGGVLGGISTGMDIIFRVAFKPVASISSPQETVTTKGSPAMLNIEGRHDPCIVPRAVAVVEAMTALVIADHLPGTSL